MKELLNTMTGNPYPAVRKAIRGDKSGLIAVAAMGAQGSVPPTPPTIYTLEVNSEKWPAENSFGNSGSIVVKDPQAVNEHLGFEVVEVNLHTDRKFTADGGREFGVGSILEFTGLTMENWEETGINLFEGNVHGDMGIEDDIAQLFISDEAETKNLDYICFSTTPSEDDDTRAMYVAQESRVETECQKDENDQNTGMAVDVTIIPLLDINPFSETYNTGYDQRYAGEPYENLESCPLPEPPQPEPEPFFIATDDNSTPTEISLEKNGNPTELTMEYSFDKENWQTYTLGTTLDISQSPNSKVWFRNSGNTRFSIGQSDYYRFAFESNADNKISVGGNIASLKSRDMSDTTSNEYDFKSLLSGKFGYNTAIKYAHELDLGNYVTLANHCFDQMFLRCTSLLTSPELPATTLVDNCYSYMFNGCTLLTSITCLAENISATDCVNGWVDGVAQSGTFTKSPNMSSWTTGVDGIPSGWTVVDAVA